MKITAGIAKDEHPDCVFYFQGSTYRFVRGSASGKHNLNVSDGFIAAFNVKTRTIRGIGRDDTITLIHRYKGIEVEPETKGVTLVHASEKAIRMRHDLSAELDKVAKAINESDAYVVNLDYVLSVQVEDHLQLIGYQVRKRGGMVKNDTFYPPFVEKEIGTVIYW